MYGSSIAWAEGLFINYQMPTEQFQRYLNAYYQAIETHLAERGHIITAWLAQVTGEGVKSS